MKSLPVRIWMPILAAQLLASGARAMPVAQTVGAIPTSTDVSQLRTTGAAASSDAASSAAVAAVVVQRISDAAGLADPSGRARLQSELELLRRATGLAVSQKTISEEMAAAAEKAQNAMDAALQSFAAANASSAAALAALSDLAASFRGAGAIGGVATTTTPAGLVTQIDAAVRLDSTQLAALAGQLATAQSELDRRVVGTTLTGPPANALSAAKSLGLQCSKAMTELGAVAPLASAVKSAGLECKRVEEEATTKLQALLSAIQQLEGSRLKLKGQLDGMRAVLARHGA